MPTPPPTPSANPSADPHPDSSADAADAAPALEALTATRGEGRGPLERNAPVRDTARRGVAGDAVLDLLAGLVAKSLVQVTHPAGAVRYGLLETVRAYAAERLTATSEGEVGMATEEEGARARHFDWAGALVEEAAPRLKGAEQGTWLDRLEAEADNLRAALRWASAHGHVERGLRMATSLSHLWYVRGPLGGALLAGTTAHGRPSGVGVGAPARQRA